MQMVIVLQKEVSKESYLNRRCDGETRLMQCLEILTNSAISSDHLLQLTMCSAVPICFSFSDASGGYDSVAGKSLLFRVSNRAGRSPGFARN